MSIDRFHVVRKNQTIEDVTDVKGRSLLHTIYQMRAGVEHLYIFRTAAEAFLAFQQWRREPCEKISLTLAGVEQPGDRLPLEKS
jgi:hypothetical protein